MRLNPNVDALTHKYITTGLEENKFGIDSDDLPRALDKLSNYDSINVIGLHFHIGSQITDLNVFKTLCTKINIIKKECVNHGLTFEYVNVGGGLGVDYDNPDANLVPDFASYFSVFNDNLILEQGEQLYFELGRAVVAQCGSLVSKVLYVKEGRNNNFAILDAGMTELLRPALYQSYHKVENISKQDSNINPSNSKYDVVGPICESSDCFGRGLTLPNTERNDLIAIRTTGAYGEVMASQYNLRKLPEAYYAEQSLLNVL